LTNSRAAPAALFYCPQEVAIADIFDWSATAASNTTVDGINIAEGCPAGNLNNAARSIMALVRNTFASALESFLVGSAALPVANGGTASTTAADARTALSAAKSGANSDITSLSALSTALSIAQGGIGQATTPFSLDGSASSGMLTISAGGSSVFRLTWKDVTANANGSTAVTYHNNFASWSRAWCSGGNQSVSATENNPFVVAGSESTSGCTLFNSENGAISCTVFAWGV
jgi:hypothetical protein